MKKYIVLTPKMNRVPKKKCMSIRFRWNRPFTSSIRRQHISTNNQFLRISEEIRDALQSTKPVVALETTIYTHGERPPRKPRICTTSNRVGFPYPDNVALASDLESLVRVNGGVPATIGVLNGVARVGMGAEEIIELLEKAGNPGTLKLSRRDLSHICGLVGSDNHHISTH